MLDVGKLFPTKLQVGHRRSDFSNDLPAIAHQHLQVLGCISGENSALMKNHDPSASHFHFRENMSGNQYGVILAEVFD